VKAFRLNMFYAAFITVSSRFDKETMYGSLGIIL
jgi:hypothetical protein